MAGYLDEYGVEEERRSRFVRRLVITAAALVAVGIGAYLTLRTWPAKSQVRTFLADLARKDYKAAYRDWGCTPSCRDYPFEKFMMDWGPQSEFGSASDTSIKRARVCNSGDILVTIASPKGTEAPLMYDARERTLSFSPWPICDPHVPPPAAAP